ncbi:MAG: pyruvate dehydrogenase (acetyl-transferring) E1 component subunit alpha [Gemmatimonadetes bacterium]|nr:pyruvate dehydrogenase (acetyl-transferring) E1 component subunit alpha [Gemmatimonadota bacterium]
MMLLIRRFEEKAGQLYGMGLIGGFCHLYIGQEAVAIGAIHALREDDYVMTAYREHVHALQKRVDPNAIMAELYGRSGGCSGGKGGSMHMFSAEHNYLGGHGIVGAHLPLAAGVGYAIRYGAEVGVADGEVSAEDAVCLCLFGDSVLNIGAFHETFNMAAKWGLPVVFVCENNSYGMGTDIRRVAAVEELVQRACAYEGMHEAAVDGMDVLATRRATDEAVRIAREEGRPSFLEARCYRYMGHSMADPSHGTYRSKKEVEEQRGDHDPILTFLKRLQEAEILTEEDYEELDREVIERVEEAAEFADASPRPEPERIYDLVYADEYRDPGRRDRWRPELPGAASAGRGNGGPEDGDG